MNTKHRKVILVITLCYTVLIFYFMFLAFGRAEMVDQVTGYSFLFLPDEFFRLPGLSNLLHPTLMDVWALGNIVAFIPFGILIPLLYRTGFFRYMILFIMCILVLETVQALTLLGSFDMNDVIQNSVGAAVGFGAFRLGFRTKRVWRNIAATCISAIVLMIGIWGSFGIVDNAFTKEQGTFVALNDLKNSGIHSSAGTKRDSFQIGEQNVEPQYNAYSTEGQQTVTYTYTLGKKELYLYLNFGIPNQEEAYGSLSVSADGQEYLSMSAEDPSDEPEMSSIYLQGANELTITLEGNARIWDVGFREMKYNWNW
ncbi:glycopeptide antibiotics resistance protein [Paenibacillus phyllosphaerae]|uniref:Glycopeptide antibiotics resistance protein n=1 Tax=Paenibacillus phyllosphaerae TaxID=274593 RepID=A0A7W5ASR4_9BACL|nr:VanZ family protein [Paenibacillus phyllosphaerae]MBB3108090.1 glycopeptide antibiotics resistance protein [Paenibacillus phyllosphaerae]